MTVLFSLHKLPPLPEVLLQPEEWDQRQEVRKLIERTPELRALYETFGYAAEVDRQSEQLMQELRGLIRADIPDFAAFQNALRDVQARFDKQEGSASTPDLWPRGSSQQASAALLHAVLAAGSDRRQVLALLNRDPVYERLPFIEQLPFHQEDKLVWRTPVEHSMIRKRPTAPGCFAALLDALEQLIHASPLSRHDKVRQEVLEAIARVRRDLQKATAYIPTSLQALERKVAAYVHHPPHPVAQARSKQLDTLLGDLLYVRYMYGLDAHPHRTAHRIDLALSCRDMAQHQAQHYLKTPWMHLPWLTTYILITLLESELAVLPEATSDAPSPPCGLLRLIRDEVASGRYDPQETIRRLRHHEENGLYVHSFIYALLRPSSTPATQKALPHTGSVPA